MKKRKPSNLGMFGYADTHSRLTGLNLRARFPHTVYATLYNPVCGYQAAAEVRRRTLQCYENLYGPTCHCVASFIVSLGVWEKM